MQEHLLQVEDDRAAALDILLLLADSRAEVREYGRALDLLDDVEQTTGFLPAEYAFKRRAWIAHA